jgi:molecular chaperone DnaK (HSP70)
MNKHNHLLSKFELRGQPQVEVAFETDSNGFVNVGAEDKDTGKSGKTTMTKAKGRLMEEQTVKMIKEAVHFVDEDKKV